MLNHVPGAQTGAIGAAACGGGGGGLMVLADWLGRTAAFPYQLPAGLLSALVGAPFLLVLLSRKAARP